jgi:hypothetical protein
MNVRVTVTLAGAVWKQPEAMAIVDAELTTALRAATAVIEGSVVKLVAQRAADTGKFAQSITADVAHPGLTLWRAQVYSPLAQADPIEFGRRPGARMPPVEAIQLWVNHKLSHVPAAQRRGVAFVIARAIARRGIPAKWVFRDGYQLVAGQVQSLFDRACDRIARRLTA